MKKWCNLSTSNITMWTESLLLLHHHPTIPSQFLHCDSHRASPRTTNTRILRLKTTSRKRTSVVSASDGGLSSNPQPLDLTENNVRQALSEARLELSQLFDDSVGITGQVELAELDGPFVKISLKGRFWHKRSTVVARLGNYLKQRIPEILEVDIEDEKQLDDSPASF